MAQSTTRYRVIASVLLAPAVLLAGCGGSGPAVNTGAYDTTASDGSGSDASNAGGSNPFEGWKSYEKKPAPRGPIQTVQGPPMSPDDVPPGTGWVCYQTQVDLHCERDAAGCNRWREANIRVAMKQGATRAEVEPYLGTCAPRASAWCRVISVNGGDRLLSCGEGRGNCTMNLPPEGMTPPPDFFEPGESGCAELR